VITLTAAPALNTWLEADVRAKKKTEINRKVLINGILTYVNRILTLSQLDFD